MNKVQLQEEIDKLTDQLRATTKEHNDRVEQLERLLVLALDYANMTQEEVEEALENKEQEALDASANAMGWEGLESLRRNK